MEIKTSEAYKRISQFYGTRKAERSQVPLIQHIDEGLQILAWLNASDWAMQAYCLHPVLQSDADLLANWQADFGQTDSQTLILCMEYRKTANAYLSKREIASIQEIELSPIEEVNQMLVADKVQNFKDFRRYHAQTHPRAEVLNQYFLNWLERLGVSMGQFEEWEKGLMKGT